ncbi:MAG: hypothetical protein Ct9H300mP2_5070 [Candidatus Neomarinimicrobiota bacterium]|nr:MAG: hypothetical protein Ct9H300mP2_5070 [Candidatus Neomarinimicrobiota bacterium]
MEEETIRKKYEGKTSGYWKKYQQSLVELEKDNEKVHEATKEYLKQDFPNLVQVIQFYLTYVFGGGKQRTNPTLRRSCIGAVVVKAWMQPLLYVKYQEV